MERSSISVVIITYNRPIKLSNTLTSLACQSIKPHEVIIVDQSEKKVAKKITDRFRERLFFKVWYVSDKSKSFAVARNVGLALVKTEWCLFIDDDCIAHFDWIKEAEKSILKHKNTVAFIGQNETRHCQNIYSLVSNISQKEWRYKVLRTSKVPTYSVFDSKNLALNKHVLNSHNIRFDENFNSSQRNAGEDLDIGIQILSNELNVRFQKDMKVYHEDPTNFTQYFLKILRGYQIILCLQKKWKTKNLDDKELKVRNISLLSRLPLFGKILLFISHKLNTIAQLQLKNSFKTQMT